MERAESERDFSECEDYEVERVDTVFRALDSILFAIIFSLVEWIVAVVVIFQLGYTLVTEQPPSRRVRDLGNRLSTYAYQVLRYLTHSSAERPFPFSDFPQALEPPRWPYPTGAEGRAARDRDDHLDDYRDDPDPLAGGER